MAAAEGESIARTVTCQAVLGFNPVSEVPGCDPCVGKGIRFSFSSFLQAFLALKQ